MIIPNGLNLSAAHNSLKLMSLEASSESSAAKRIERRAVGGDKKKEKKTPTAIKFSL